MAFNVVDGWTVPGFTHDRELGNGASGRVMLATDDMTSTKVAIKYLDAGLAADEAFLAAFRASARALSQLEDPNVVDLYDFVETPDGAAIVMQYAEGVSMRRVLAAQGPTGPLAALSMLGGTLLGLAAAHEAGVVHGAMRPANILVDGNGNATLTDFATSPAGTEAQSAPPYAAPELWDGAPATVATDLYAATAVFYECLTGRPPYAGRNMARLHREAPIPADEVPGPLRHLIHQGLAKDPAERPRSVADFLGALEDAAVSAYGPSWEAQGRGRLAELGAQAAAQPEPPKPKSSRSSGLNPIAAATGKQPGGGGSRTRWILAAVAVLVVVGAGASATTLLRGDENPPPDPAPAQSSTPQPTLPAGGVDPRPLVAQIDQAVAQAPGAQFSYRQTGCCGFPATAKGTFGLVQGEQPSYSLTLAGTGSARKPVRGVIVDDQLHVRAGRQWKSSALGGRGYPAAADQVRQGSSVTNLTTLLRSATKLTKEEPTETGTIYEGEAPAAKMAQAPGIGPMYARMAQATGAQQIAFAIKVDPGHRPTVFWVRAGPEDGRNQTMHGSYTKWGRKPPIKAPRAD
ncbi:serine/threonine-protein kinase [Actinomadura sp. 7K507]|uniref:serine/threonine-protein kinase n=1 Tax=Actinomadura sp. 7K507 TaxID=2530365 RepID=UPI00104DB619|nr:serine/threonine-protein kinase [Actinomadura sp. 7K507]TDC82620.1 serine/threonine protein kinase [Actinomadura sp. 7K507]